MAVALCRRTRFAAGDSRRARRDHHRDVIAVRRDRLVGGYTIIGAVRCQLGNRIVKLIEQRADL